MSRRIVHVHDRVPGAIYIGRPVPNRKGSDYANPFKIPRDGTRKVVIAKHFVWLFQTEDGRFQLYRYHRLRTADAVECWCRHDGELLAPENECHGDTILYLLDRFTDIELGRFAIGLPLPLDLELRLRDARIVAGWGR